MDPSLNLILGVGLTLGMIISFVFVLRRKPGQTRRARDIDLE